MKQMTKNHKTDGLRKNKKTWNTKQVLTQVNVLKNQVITHWVKPGLF